jgi:hypothetical protein
MQLREARQGYRLRETFLDMQGFVQDIKDISRTGEEALNPRKALDALESPGYANLKNWLTLMPGDKPGKTLYDDTVANFQTMTKTQMTVRDAQVWYAQLKATGDPRGKLYDITPRTPPVGSPPTRTSTPPIPESALPVVPPKGGAPQQPVPERVPPLRDEQYLTPNPPPAPTPQEVPRPLDPLDPASLAPVPGKLPNYQGAPIHRGFWASTLPYALPTAAAATAALVSPSMSWTPAGMAGMAAVGGLTAATQAGMAALLMKPAGQKLLVKLITERGLRLDPVTTGILTSAVRQGVSYGLPQDMELP